jgi:hypothetical protein
MSTSKQLKFKISQLRQDKVVYAVEAIAVFIFCIFVSLFLPNLLLRYVYTDPKMTELPKVLEYIPAISFAVGLLYFVYAMLGNVMRRSLVTKLEKELDTAWASEESSNCGCGCGDGACSCDHDHDMDSMMAEPVKESTKSGSVSLLAQKMKSSRGRRSTKKA